MSAPVDSFWMLEDALYTTIGPGTAMMGLRPEQHPVWPSSKRYGSRFTHWKSSPDHKLRVYWPILSLSQVLWATVTVYYQYYHCIIHQRRGDSTLDVSNNCWKIEDRVAFLNFSDFVDFFLLQLLLWRFDFCPERVLRADIFFTTLNRRTFG